MCFGIGWSANKLRSLLAEHLEAEPVGELVGVCEYDGMELRELVVEEVRKGRRDTKAPRWHELLEDQAPQCSLL
jgi:hypothetical protein